MGCWLFTATTVHPGWDGVLALEMINLGPVPFVLTLGMPIAQLIVEEVKGIPSSNASQFQGQTGPGGGVAAPSLGRRTVREEAAAAVTQADKPLSGLSLAVAALVSSIKRLLGRGGGRKRGRTA